MTGLPSHHPPEEFLLDYADGTIDPAFALVIAVHATACPDCRAAIAALEEAGGALLESCDEEPLDRWACERVLSRCDAPAADEAEGAAIDAVGALARDWPLLPAPLRRHVASSARCVGVTRKWQRVLPGIERLLLSQPGAEVRLALMRFAGNRAAPAHAQAGPEFTAVLQGGFHDDYGRFRVGDVGLVEGDTPHSPIADAAGCLCLAAWQGPFRLTSFPGRLLNRLIDF